MRKGRKVCQVGADCKATNPITISNSYNLKLNNNNPSTNKLYAIRKYRSTEMQN